MATTTLQNAATSDGNGTAATGLTGPCTLQLSGTFAGAQVRFEFSVDGGTTYSPVSWQEAQNGPGGVTIDVKGTYAIRAPIYGARTSPACAITVVASYA